MTSIHADCNFGYKQVKCDRCSREYTCTPWDDFYCTPEGDHCCEPCLVGGAEVIRVDPERLVPATAV